MFTFAHLAYWIFEREKMSFSIELEYFLLAFWIPPKM
jgi:hypothetical protein